MPTKKDFETTAEIIRRTKEHSYGLENVVLDFAMYYQRQNKDFNRRKFLTACGYSELE